MNNASNSRRLPGNGSPAARGKRPTDNPSRWPEPDERRRIAAELGLGTPELSNRLWESVYEFILDFRRYQARVPRAGPERWALNDRIEDFSKGLADAQVLLQRPTSHLDHQLGRLLGPRLAAMLGDDALHRLSAAYQDPYISIHIRDYLDPQGDPDGPDRAYVARYHEAVGRLRLLARMRALEEEAGPVLQSFLSELNAPLQAYLGTRAQDVGGTPARVFRNGAIRRLAVVYERLDGKPATPTAGGPFLNFCGVILEAIGIDSDGLRGAAIRELKKLKG